jgi:arylsulfatase A-like enzyme
MESEGIVRTRFELPVAMYRRVGSAAAALAMSVATLTAVGEGPRPPNFVLILTDDQGWSQLSEAMDPDLPAARSNYLETPNLTRLARQGIRFSSGYSPAPLGAIDHTSGPPHFIDDDDPKRTPSVTREAIRFMREQVAADRPFAVQASYYAVHLSVVCRQETLEKFKVKGPPDRGYSEAWAAMLAELDAGVGQLLDAVEDLGIAGNTYVIFTSDNGGRGTVPGGDPARPAPNHPLTGAKHSLFEGGIRVPFIVCGADPSEEGRDIAPDDPARADRLQALLLAHLEEIRDGSE